MFDDDKQVVDSFNYKAFEEVQTDKTGMRWMTTSSEGSTLQWYSAYQMAKDSWDTHKHTHIYISIKDLNKLVDQTGSFELNLAHTIAILQIHQSYDVNN